MTDNEVLEMLKSIVLQDLENCAKDVANGGETMSHFISMDGVGGIGFYMTPWQSDHDKDMMTASIRQLFFQNGVVGYALVSEVWYLSIPPGESRPPGQPSDYPHLRKEALMAVVETNSTKLQVKREIIREGGVTVGEPEFLDMTAGESRGRMTGLLPVRH